MQDWQGGSSDTTRTLNSREESTTWPSSCVTTRRIKKPFPAKFELRQRTGGPRETNRTRQPIIGRARNRGFGFDGPGTVGPPSHKCRPSCRCSRDPPYDPEQIVEVASGEYDRVGAYSPYREADTRNVDDAVAQRDSPPAARTIDLHLPTIMTEVARRGSRASVRSTSSNRGSPCPTAAPASRPPNDAFDREHRDTQPAGTRYPQTRAD